MPWFDVVVDFTYDGGVMSIGALPGAMTDLTLPFSPWSTAPTASCTPTNPKLGGTPSCVIALTTGLRLRNTILHTVTSPAGARITACTSGWFLGCGTPADSSVLITCSFGCPNGSGYTVRITSSVTGALTHSLVLTPNEGSSPVLLFAVTPSPAVNFGTGVGAGEDSVALLSALEAAVADVGPGNSLVPLVAQARHHAEAGRTTSPACC